MMQKNLKGIWQLGTHQTTIQQPDNLHSSPSSLCPVPSHYCFPLRTPPPPPGVDARAQSNTEAQTQGSRVGAMLTGPELGRVEAQLTHGWQQGRRTGRGCGVTSPG